MPLSVHTAPTAMSPELPTSPELTPLHDDVHEVHNTHKVPGENSIDPHETAGLSGTNIENYSRKQAQKVVSVHKNGSSEVSLAVGGTSAPDRLNR